VRFQIPAIGEIYDLVPSESTHAQEGFADLDALANGQAVDAPRDDAATVAEDHAVTFALSGGPRSAAIDERQREPKGAAACLEFLLGIWQSVAAFRKPSNLLTFILLVDAGGGSVSANGRAGSANALLPATGGVCIRLAGGHALVHGLHDEPRAMGGRR